MRDVVNITIAVLFSSIGFLTCIVLIFGIKGFPRSVLIMDGIMTFLLLTGVRVLVRIYRENLRTAKNSRIGENILIGGAGSAGVIILKE
jgi:FlaA1/EpsC-like NDP-sugar epimerase